jgi:hypothetical protein
MKIEIKNEKNNLKQKDVGNSLMVESGEEVFWLFEDAEGKIRIESRGIMATQVQKNALEADSITLKFGEEEVA